MTEGDRDRWVLALEAALVWVLVALLDHGLKPKTAPSAGIPFAMERAGQCHAATVQSSQWHLALPGLILAQSHQAATSGTPLSPGMSGLGVGRCPLGHNRGLLGWVSTLHMCFASVSGWGSDFTAQQQQQDIRKGCFGVGDR